MRFATRGVCTQKLFISKYKQFYGKILWTAKSLDVLSLICNIVLEMSYLGLGLGIMNPFFFYKP